MLFQCALLSGSCYGLQKMVDKCSDYGIRFDIRFNLFKSQTTVTVFEGCVPSHFPLWLNQTTVPYVDKVKYLGMYFINSVYTTVVLIRSLCSVQKILRMF